jgi:septum site-determining protein MinD
MECPAGIEHGFRNAIAGSDEAIVVTTPQIAAVRDADRIIGLLEANDLNSPKLIVNRIEPDMVRKGDMMTIDDIVGILAIDLIGVVPDDQSIVVSTNKGEPAVTDKRSMAGKAYNNIARRIIGENVPFIDIMAETSFFGRLKKLINRNND